MVKVVFAGIVRCPPRPKSAVTGEDTVLAAAKTQPPIYGNGAIMTPAPLLAS